MPSALDALVDPAVELTCIGSGYQFTEGPVWVSARGCLLFHDIPSDVRWRYTDGGGMAVDLTPTFKGNGMALDMDGSVLVCEQVSSCLTRFRPDGRRELAAFHYRGTYLNSPNDVVVRGADGSVYFTDPDYGRWNDWIGCERSRLLGFRGLYRLPAGGGVDDLELVVEEGEFDQPNGLCFSPDESLLYVNDSSSRNVKVFDVRPDGSLGPARLLHEGIGSGIPREGNVDGMECDELGNVWVTGPGGVWVLTPGGEHLGVVQTPEVCGSLAWGGGDMRTLFLTTTTTVHTIRTLVGPAPLPPG